MRDVFRTIHGVPLSREAWVAVVDASSKAFAAALGEDYGNLMEARMVLDEMAADGDLAARAALARIDALVVKARRAEDAALRAALRKVRV